MEITDSDRISFLKKYMGKFDTRSRYNKEKSQEEYMLTYLGKDDKYTLSTAESLEDAIDNAIVKCSDHIISSSVDHIPHSL